MKAQKVDLQKNGVIRQGYIGFSWTNLFFGAWVPLFRNDWKNFFIMFLVIAGTYGIAQFVFPFFYNKTHLNKLLDEGWTPIDDKSTNLLKGHGYIL